MPSDDFKSRLSWLVHELSVHTSDLLQWQYGPCEHEGKSGLLWTWMFTRWLFSDTHFATITSGCPGGVELAHQYRWFMMLWIHAISPRHSLAFDNASNFFLSPNQRKETWSAIVSCLFDALTQCPTHWFGGLFIDRPTHTLQWIMLCSQLACCLHMACYSIASWIHMLGRWIRPVAVFLWSWRLSSSPFLHIDCMPSVLAEEEDTTDGQWTCLRVHGWFPWAALDSCLSWKKKMVRSRRRCPPPWGWKCLRLSRLACYWLSGWR